MTKHDILRAWSAILQGRTPALSIELTKECPLRCPGCYAYDAAHLGGLTVLKQLNDFRGAELVTRVLQIVDELRPLHVSLVGGDPLVRYRELEQLIPELLRRAVFVQVVTSAFRPIPNAWKYLRNFQLVVSIDGLQPEHDARRSPATYERILKNIHGQQATIHCTITSQMMRRHGYLAAFVEFWSANPDVKKIWMSIFTPQVGAVLPETPTTSERNQIVADLLALRNGYPKLDMGETQIRSFLTPPASPDECIFAKTVLCFSADLKTKISPCQFGGNPDCSRCGCVASMGLAAVGSYRLPFDIPVSSVFGASFRIGESIKAAGLTRRRCRRMYHSVNR